MDKSKPINQLRCYLSEISAIMYKIYVEWFVSEKPVMESEHIAGSMYRMMIFKAKSICQMSEGIVVIPTQKGIIPDPSTMYPVLRSMYEMLFLFKCMFVSSKNDKERELLLNLWKIKGNNNIVQIPDNLLNDESKNNKQLANGENEMARRETRTQMTELNLPQSVIDAIEYSIDDSKNSTKLSGFLLNHDGQNESITSIGALPFSDKNLGATLSGDSYIYSHYSAHSHPSYLGVKHFEEMYKNNEEDKYVQEILLHACKFLARFMTEFCAYRDSYRPFYDKNASHINNLMGQLLNDNQQS